MSTTKHIAPPATHEARGLALYQDHIDEIRFEQGVWLVPSQHDAASVYELTIGRRGESCECRDFAYRGGRVACLHIHAATIARAKTTSCSCCGQRFPWRFVTEVQEDHDLLAWFVGDRLCSACVPGHWA
jgi:hypothetical protein